MRELTTLEIEQFDFTGRIPELNMPTYRNNVATAAKTSGRKHSLKANPFAKRPHKKRRPQLGMARTA